MHRSPRRIPLVLLFCVVSSCASMKFEHTTATSGTFVSSGRAFTIFSIDLPRPALQIARENASDAGMAHMVVEEARVSPDWGWWNWVLDIVSVRKATIKGTWGFDGAD
jgi:hypothetical protein